MPLQKDMEKCGVFGCGNPQHENLTLTVEVPHAGQKTIRICLYHDAIVNDHNIDVSIGLTFRGEVEIRPKPKVAPPTEPVPAD